MSASPDPATIRATYRWLNHAPHGATELRAIKTGGGVAAIGYYTNVSAFVRDCMEANAIGNVYAGIQPRPMRFLAEAPNTLVRRSSGGRSQDIEIVSATVIDLDPKRPRDTASTDAERDEALAVAGIAAVWLESEGFIRPLVMMSGNGAQLWLPFDPIPLDPTNRSVVAANLKLFEARVRDRFETAKIKVDSIHDLGRIIKIIGTVGRKGDDTPERPHRLSYPVDSHTRQPCTKLREWLLTPQPEAPVAPKPTGRRTRAAGAASRGPRLSGVTTAPAVDHHHLPVVNTTAPQTPISPLTSSAPVSLCSPFQRLWDVGYPSDRSRALFGVTMLLAHKGVPPGQITEEVTAFDARTGGKLTDRDAPAYIQRDYRKILTTTEGDEVKPPCKMVQEMGYCPVNVVHGAVCELADPVIDIDKAIRTLAAESPSTERDYRLRRIFDAVAAYGATDALPYRREIADRFGLDEATIDGAVQAAVERARLRREERDQGRVMEVEIAATAVSSPSVAPSIPFYTGKVVPLTMDGEIQAEGANYLVLGRDERRVISSFVLTPTRRITTERGEVIVANAKTDLGSSFTDIYLPREAFASRRDLLRRLPSPDMQWTGDDKHVQGLLRRLASAQGVVRQQGTTTLGGYGPDANRLWVYPGGAISREGFVDPPPVVYVPTGNTLDGKVRYERVSDTDFASIAGAVFMHLPQVNLPAVTVPLIGWFFAAVLKPWVMRRYGAFPVLNVTGTGGTGKTSVLCEIFMPLCGVPDAEPGSVTGTEFPLLRQLSSTTTVPNVLDEYKPQDMPQHRIDQIHRIARRIYKGEAEERGNADQSVTTYHLTAPMVLSGEARPTDAALLERFITASPAKGTLEAHRSSREAFAQLRATRLHLVAPRYIQFALGRDLDADLAEAERRTGAVVADRPLPLRVVTNLRVMALGVHLFEQFAEASDLPLKATLDLAAGVEAVIRDVTGGGAHARNGLDDFIETIAVMASQRELRDGGEYKVKEGNLYLRFEQTYAAYRKHLRAIGTRENPIEREPLRRLIRENFAQGGYIASDPDADTRVYFTSAQRYHAIAIDIERAAHLLGGEFQPAPATLGQWPVMEER